MIFENLLKNLPVIFENLLKNLPVIFENLLKNLPISFNVYWYWRRESWQELFWVSESGEGKRRRGEIDRSRKREIDREKES